MWLSVLEIKWLSFITQVAEYVRNACDSLCEKLAENILTNYEKNQHLEEDQIYEEIMQHRKFAIEKTTLFVGREEILNKMVEGASNLQAKKPFVIVGKSGNFIN